ncbi:hypothetical protein QF035_004095 [Streptomyces umbrinus]|uniref:DUF4291 domain-containing protein n=1 Tax=Streptomyces umbrinus TaxID=67370 RepID=A0ABU0SSL9_9ACTN|nr:hypothetical protein [Streptomyces umbrinus]
MEEPHRRIRAVHSKSTITGYQAYAPEIGLPSVREDRFPSAWKGDRMTWITKPRSSSFPQLGSGGSGTCEHRSCELPDR